MDENECVYARQYPSAFWHVFSSNDEKNRDLDWVCQVLISVLTLQRKHRSAKHPLSFSAVRLLVGFPFRRIGLTFVHGSKTGQDTTENLSRVTEFTGPKKTRLNRSYVHF